MASGFRARLLALVGLAALGVGVAVVATAVAPAGTHTDPGASFVVANDNVTVKSGGEPAVVENVSGSERVEIERVSANRFEVRAEPPLTDRERQLARMLATSNETVRAGLDAMGEYDVAVEPIRKLTTGSAERINGTDVDINESEMEVGGSEAVFAVRTDNMTAGDDGSVVVDRNPSYVDDEASVRIRRPASDELRYSVRVDLANETVLDVTDWAELHAE